MIGIYKITSPTDRIYIGQSTDIERRFRFYKRLNCKRQPVLYRSLLKYGSELHTFEIIEECLLELLNVRERYWQEHYKVLNGGLNCNLVSTDELSKVHSQDTKDKISKAHIGKTVSIETRLKMSEIKKIAQLGENNTFFGKHHTSEFRKERSIQRSGGGNPNAKMVLNLETGIYYDSCRDAALAINMNRGTLSSWLSGKYTNKSSFIYV